MPTATVHSADGGTIGLIEMDCCPAYCCKHSLTIYKGSEKQEGSLWRKIEKCMLNCHCCCSVQCCGSIGKELTFSVTDSMQNSQEQLKKVHSGCYRECCTGADMYEVTLPADESEAALFLAAIQMLDMIYFENPWGCVP